jgi:hypothetical protein
MKYVGPFGSRDGAEAYLREIERLRLKFDIQRVFADSKDVCALYDITVSGITVFACGWFQIEAGKVSSLRVKGRRKFIESWGLCAGLFDPITEDVPSRIRERTTVAWTSRLTALGAKIPLLCRGSSSFEVLG